MSWLKNTGLQNRAWGLLILCYTFLLTACQDSAKLTVTNCSDQDYEPISREVRITVDNETQSWRAGERCEFKIPLDGQATRDVAVRADAGPLYFFKSLETITVGKGQPDQIELRFFRPYLITVNVFDANNQPLENVELSVEGRRIGVTTVGGSHAWSIEEPDYLAGANIRIELSRDGAKGFAEPVALEKGKFEYITSGKLAANFPPDIEKVDPVPPRPVVPKTPAYTIRIQAVGTQGQALAGVKLTDENGAAIGFTNKNGSFVWQAKEPKVSVGSTVNIQMSKDGKTGAAEPVTIASGQFSYVTRGQLDIEPPAKRPPTRIDPDPAPIPTPIPPPERYSPTPALAQCRQLVDAGKYEDAITCFERIPNPGAAGTDSQVKDYVNAQHQVGYLYWEQLGEYLQAVQAFQNIVNVDPREWTANYNLALVYYRTNAFAECRRACDKVAQLRHLIPVDKLNKVEPEVMFLKGLCQYRIYQDETERLRKQESGLLALSELEDFVARARSLPAFQQQRQEAEEMINTLEQELPSLQ